MIGLGPTLRSATGIGSIPSYTTVWCNDQHSKYALAVTREYIVIIGLIGLMY
jgi:hypothetical protein